MKVFLEDVCVEKKYEMNKYLKIFILFLVCIYVGVSSRNLVFAENYNITGYDQNIVVNSNNTYDITSSISVMPLSDAISFDYTIPTRTSDNTKILVKDIKVKNAEFGKITNRNNTKVRIIDNKSLVSKTYIISYTLDVGEDYITDSDNISINLIPSDINSTIPKFSFSLVMPEEYSYTDIKLTKFSKDDSEEKETRISFMNDFKYTYNRESGVLNADYKQKLNYMEGIKLNLQLPEGYFSGERSNRIITLIILILSIIAFISLTIYFFINGRDEEILSGKSSKIPDELSPAYVAVLIDAMKGINCSEWDVGEIYKIYVPMIIYWANKGYLTVKENCVNNLNGDKNMIVTRRTDFNITNMSLYERILFDGIFILGNEGTIDFRVVRAQIQNNDPIFLEKRVNFLEYMKAYKEQINDYVFKTVQSGINEKLNKAYSNLKYIPVVILNIFNIVTALLDYTVLTDLIYPVVYLIFSIILINIAKKQNEAYTLHSFVAMIALFIIGLGIKIETLPYILISATTFLHIILRKHNFELMAQLKKISSLRKFINSGNRKILVDALADDDLYFYNAFPYAMTFELQDRWISKCKDFRVRTPDWYIKNTESKKNLYVQNMDKFISEFVEFAEQVFVNIRDSKTCN